jgi:UDP-2,4-diacetamido-2,4,6-trideoxy-beta-L-altropyranose hydrolase
MPVRGAAPRVLFRADASERMGGGHIMRCLALADALAARGASVGFVCATLPQELARRITAGGYAFWQIEPTPDLLDVTGNWDKAVLSAEAQAFDAAQTAGIARAEQVDWVVLDHYRLDRRWGEAVRPTTAGLLVVDDLANRAHDCDVLVDQTLGRRADNYTDLVPAGCRTLLGARYAILRAEFAQARNVALQRRRHAPVVKKLLVSLGTTDIDGITIRVLQALSDAGITCPTEVVVGRSAPSHDAVQRLAERVDNLAVHVDSSEMAAVITSADLAVGAAGTSSWERCCLGLPAVTITLAENQRLIAERLAGVGASVATDSPAEAAAAVAALLGDPAQRARMTAAAAALTAGRGATLVADEMLHGPMTEPGDGPGAWRLRAATPLDSEVIWLWRNDPVMRAMAKTSEPIVWADHLRWFEDALRSDASALYLLEADDRPAAMINFDSVEDFATVSINVNPGMRGRGIGRRALVMACEHYEAVAAPSSVLAEVKAVNEPSLRLFRRAGFREEGRVEAGFIRLVRSAAPLVAPTAGGRA